MSDLLASIFAFFLVGYVLILLTDFASGLVHLWHRSARTIHKPVAKFDNNLLSNQIPVSKIATLDWIQPVEEAETLGCRFASPNVFQEESFESIDIIALAKSRLPRLDITALKIYKLRGESVVKLQDIPLDVPSNIKRYKLRGFDVVKLALVERLITV